MFSKQCSLVISITLLQHANKNTMNLARTYRIETERLVVRCYNPADAPMLYSAVSASIDHLLPWMPWAQSGSSDDVETITERLRLFRGKFDLGQDYILGIFNKSETECIGGTGLHTRIGSNAREIGYWISKNHINQGFATESTAALTKVGFEIEQLHRIEIHCAPENIRSQSIPKKLGYRLEAVLKGRTSDADGNARDSMIWTMFKSDYEKSAVRTVPIKAFDAVGNEINFKK